MQTAVSECKAKQPIVEANTVTRPAGGWDADVVSEADRQALVKTIQTLLADQGYDPGPADGIVGPKTRQAVKAYQQKTGMPETGQIDADAPRLPVRRTLARSNRGGASCR